MENIQEQLKEKVDNLLHDSTLFLVDLKIKPTNNIKVFIDGDTGVTIDAVSKINRALYKDIESSGLFPADDFSLEVSSPGVDEPLRLFRQYPKNIGREVAVTLTDGSSCRGRLLEATEAEIVVEEKKVKKQEATRRHIPFESIQTTIVQITF